MVLAHGGLKIGGGQVLGVGLMGTPLHEQAVTDTAECAGDGHGRGAANPAAVVVVGGVQALVQAVFDAAKARPVELQPLLGIEFVGLGTGQQGDVFVLATVALAQQSGCLRG